MTKAENEFDQSLQQAIGSAHMIYPQAHLDLFLDHKIKGQDWRAALSKIQRKSVDFLICSRDYYNPLVAIELDDSSHDLEERKERDGMVQQAFDSAGMPLVRFGWQDSYDENMILEKLAPYLR